jgi:hypothetical protein
LHDNALLSGENSCSADTSIVPGFSNNVNSIDDSPDRRSLTLHPNERQEL